MSFYISISLFFLLIIGSLVYVGSCMSKDMDRVIYRNYKFGTYIPYSQQEDANKLLESIIEKANPHSDEEPEDNIKQAQETVHEMFGVRTIGILRDGIFIPYHELPPEMKEECLKTLNIKDGSLYERDD